MIGKSLNYISTISSVVTIILLYSFIAITDNFYFNGYIVLTLMLMLMNPIANLCRLNKKIIHNPIFHILTCGLNGYISYVSIHSILIYNNNLNGTTDKSLALNASQQYFGDKLLYILGATFLLLLFTLLFKKEKKISTKDNSKIMISVILLSSILPIVIANIWTMGLLSAGFDIALLIFSFITFLKFNSFNTANELKRYYFIILICSILSINPIAVILSIYIYLQLDTFGVRV